jgi:hypothetical protein
MPAIIRARTRWRTSGVLLGLAKELSQPGQAKTAASAGPRISAPQLGQRSSRSSGHGVAVSNGRLHSPQRAT